MAFVEYQYFEVPTNFTEDKWVQAIEVRPGAREVVHHVIVVDAAPQAGGAGRRLPVRGGHGHSAADRRDRPRPRPTRRAAKDRASSRGRSGSARSSPGSRPARAVQLRSRHGRVDSAGLDDRAPDALHAERQGSERPHEGRLHLREAPARARDAARHADRTASSRSRPARRDHVVKAEMTTGADVTLRSLLPHTHLRGKELEVHGRPIPTAARK